MLGRRRDAREEGIGNFAPQPRLARLHGGPQQRRRVGLRPRLSDQPNQPDLRRIDVRLRHLPERSILLEEHRGTPVGEKGDGQVNHASERGCVVERVGEHPAGLGEETSAPFCGSRFAVQPRIICCQRRAPGELLGERQVRTLVPPARLSRHERDGAERPASGGERHDHDRHGLRQREEAMPEFFRVHDQVVGHRCHGIEARLSGTENACEG